MAAQGDAADRLLELGYRPEAVRNVRVLADWRFREPCDVARVLDNVAYEHDWAQDYQIRSAQASLLRPRIMCINAAILAYALLECFPHVRRTLLALHRRGPDGMECGHVVTAFWAEDGRVGAFSKSNYTVLNHRPAEFDSIEALAVSYARGYLSMGFTPLYYGCPRLEEMEAPSNWRLGRQPLTRLLDRFTDSYEYAFDLEGPKVHA